MVFGYSNCISSPCSKQNRDVSRDIQGEKSRKDTASSGKLVSLIEA